MKFSELDVGGRFSPTDRGYKDCPPPGVYTKVANPVTCKETGIIFNALNEQNGKLFHFDEKNPVCRQPYTRQPLSI